MRRGQAVLVVAALIQMVTSTEVAVRVAGSHEAPGGWTRTANTGIDALLPDTGGSPPEAIGRVRVPALGIDRAVYYWGCHGGTLPNRVYRWTCSGAGNTFLLGHAASVFAPLYRAQQHHALRRGTTLTYAAGGVEQTYRLVYSAVIPLRDFWPPLPRYYWLFNSSNPPVMTLVTCFGAHSRSRLIARFALRT